MTMEHMGDINEHKQMKRKTKKKKEKKRKKKKEEEKQRRTCCMDLAKYSIQVIAHNWTTCSSAHHKIENIHQDYELHLHVTHLHTWSYVRSLVWDSLEILQRPVERPLFNVNRTAQKMSHVCACAMRKQRVAGASYKRNLKDKKRRADIKKLTCA
jgi:hypothetical protein